MKTYLNGIERAANINLNIAAIGSPDAALNIIIPQDESMPMNLSLMLAPISIPSSGGGGFVARVVAYILIGQSNMVGRATYDGLGGHPSGVLQVARTGSLSGGTGGALVDAENMLDHVNPVSGDMGMSIAFAEAWTAAHPGDTLVFIPCAEGSTGFGTTGGTASWNPGDARYEEAVARSNTFFTANPNVELGGFAWHQGEATDDPALYAAALYAMIRAFREDVTVANEDTPFVLGGLGEFATDLDANRAARQAIIEAVPSEIARTAYASRTGLTDKGDSLHFSAASLRVLGGRYYDAFAAAVANVATPPGAPTSLAATPSNGQVALTWTAPTDTGGVLLSDYRVEHSDDAGATWTVFSDGVSTVTNVIVTGLTNGTSYSFRVSAINSAGAGTPSSTISATPTEVAAVSILAYGHAEQPANLSAYTFTGIPSATGDMVVAVVAPIPQTVTLAVTVNGVAATPIDSAMRLAGTEFIALHRAPVSGASAEVVVTFSALVSRCAISAWSLDGADVASATTASTEGVNGGTSGSSPVSTDTALTTVAGGVILAAMLDASTGAARTWSSPLSARLGATVVEGANTHCAADGPAAGVDVSPTVTVPGGHTAGLIIAVHVPPA